ncbi:DNA sulfur modification protein DndD [Desulfococcaceae bacterium HSG7]|nr:DNA sulfur modification protein DndD [Desulfococcaceae bacterium HSG7]
MIISRVIFNNFRPYYLENEIDLNVYPDKNIIIIGGRNGQGKTSFIMGLVWCLYGKRINEVDEIYRKELRGGYPLYLTKSLNWNARDEGIENFSVSLFLEHVYLPESISGTQDKLASVNIHREYDKNSEFGEVNIFINENRLELDDDDKVIFIDEYIIPIEAAKFVFFDAEKISEIAEMNLRQQGSVMNDALGKVLGLDIYEELIDDFLIVRDNLKKESAPERVYKQIEHLENGLTLNQKRLENIQNVQDSTDEEIEKLKIDILKLEEFLAERGGQAVKVDIEEIHKRKDEIEMQRSTVFNRLLQIEGLIPFSIGAGKLQEVVEQIHKQNELDRLSADKEDIENMKHVYLESLFNKPPFFENNDLNFKQKIFYYEKADNLLKKIFLDAHTSETEQDYELDLSKSDKEHIFNIYELVQRTSEEVYEKIFKDYLKNINELDEIKKKIRHAESMMDDEIISEYKSKRDSTEIEKEKLILKRGAFKNERIHLETEIKSIEEKKNKLLDKIEASEARKVYIDGLSRYINTLKEFIERQKKEKCERIGQSITDELKNLMHKDDFIDKAEVFILPNNDGLAVELYDSDSQKIAQSDLSKGEQQLYISCLLKAISDESIIDLPAFIDTPLARLDEEHKQHLMHRYYPNLASQTVIFATDSEISNHRLKQIQKHVAKTYLLKNVNNKTQIIEGYF